MSNPKLNASKEALTFVKDGMIIALGSGSTACEFIRLLAEKIKNGLKVECVSTSFDSTILATELGIKVIPFNQVDKVDLAVDGADVITKNALLKGGGGACTIEKIIDYYADKFIVVGDEDKVKDSLIGKVVVEVLPVAYKSVMTHFKNAEIRKALRKLGPVITDNGNFLLDIEMEVMDPIKAELEISNIPGVVGNGIFTKFDIIIIGTEDSARIL